jgi:hypothetical protein
LHAEFSVRTAPPRLSLAGLSDLGNRIAAIRNLTAKTSDMFGETDRHISIHASG